MTDIKFKHVNIYEPFSFMKQTFKCISYDENSFTMDFLMEPKGFVPDHFHAFMDEHFEITGGEGEFIVEGKKISAKPGDSIMIKKGVKHSLKTTSTTPMTCKVVYSPCSDTHKMFAIFGGLVKDGYSGMKLVIKAEYLCRKAKLKAFSKSPGFMGLIEHSVMSLVKPMGRIKGWDKKIQIYLREN